jgi:hypothetical protein
MRQTIMIFVILFSNTIFGQELISSTKKFDLEIYEYLNK